MAIKFGTDGWRGIIGDDFVFANVEIVTQSIADYMMEKDIAGRGVVLAHDTRFMTERFADLVASVFLANHIKVYRPQGPVPTPLAAFSVRELGSRGAVMLTPKRWKTGSTATGRLTTQPSFPTILTPSINSTGWLGCLHSSA
ncbi:phosphoglucomutase, partial [Candidatus Hakubella thermalkaliphila]